MRVFRGFVILKPQKPDLKCPPLRSGQYLAEKLFLFCVCRGLRENEPSQALRASSPEGRAKTVKGTLLASPFERLPPVGGRCRAATKRGQGVTEGDGEGAPAPLRGAAAAAAEGPINRRSEKKVQRRRLPPAADTGRSCWGSGQQDTSAAQGTKWTLGTATRLSEAASIFPLRLLLWGH